VKQQQPYVIIGAANDADFEDVKILAFQVVAGARREATALKQEQVT